MCSENVDMVLHAEEEPFSVNVRVFELTLLNKQALYEEKKKRQNFWPQNQLYGFSEEKKAS